MILFSRADLMADTPSVLLACVSAVPWPERHTVGAHELLVIAAAWLCAPSRQVSGCTLTVVSQHREWCLACRRCSIHAE